MALESLSFRPSLRVPESHVGKAAMLEEPAAITGLFLLFKRSHNVRFRYAISSAKMNAIVQKYTMPRRYATGMTEGHGYRLIPAPVSTHFFGKLAQPWDCSERCRIFDMCVTVNRTGRSELFSGGL